MERQRLEQVSSVGQVGCINDVCLPTDKEIHPVESGEEDGESSGDVSPN